MSTSQKKYLITSALPYVNGTKHLGNLAGSMLPADVYARFLRQKGHETLLICATDDHGTTAEISAAEEGLSPADYCAKMNAVQKDLYARFGLSFDHFGRTSSPQNHALTQHLAKKLEENGYITLKSMRQLYSKADEKFLADRYVIGTCPHCSYDKARGDQCENCGKELDPEELINPRSSISGSTDLEFRDTMHAFLKLPELSDDIRAWVDSHADWPHLVKSIAHKWLNEGLQERCITRDLKWGVPCNITGLEEGKVFYVWFDAPIGYLSATQEWADAAPTGEARDWKSWWYDVDDKVCYVEFMAKDNIPFHTVNFPATLIGSKEPWKRVDYLKGFNWLNYYGSKFSTSQKLGVFTHDALEILPPDYWRYYLLARSPENSDSSFTWEDFQAVVNKDLVGVIGNAVNRITKFARAQFGEAVPEAGPLGEVEEKYLAQFQAGLDAYNAELTALNFRKASEALRSMWVSVNEYLAEGAPWTAIKTDRGLAGARVNFALSLIMMLVKLSKPLIPFTCEKLEVAFGLNGADTAQWYDNARTGVAALSHGTRTVGEIPLLFERLEDERMQELKVRFGGGATEAAA